MCVCVCVYVCVCVFVYMCVCVYVFIHANTFVYVCFFYRIHTVYFTKTLSALTMLHVIVILVGASCVHPLDSCLHLMYRCVCVSSACMGTPLATMNFCSISKVQFNFVHSSFKNSII